MNSTLASSLYSVGHKLDPSPASWGELRDSSPLRHDVESLRERMEEDGYLYFRGFFRRELISRARLAFLKALQSPGIFREPLETGQLVPGASIPKFSPKAVRNVEEVKRVVFGPEIRAFYEGFLGGPIRHFDYVWARTVGPGHGTNPHCDIVYMGRGTKRLYTAWIPYGDVTFDIGGLTILEQSHKHASRIRNYLETDVDTYCENQPDRVFSGSLSKNPVSLREKFGGRWLSAEFEMGDLLTFRMDTIHASLDNQTDKIRLSTDTRYQLADEPVDERWIGDNPIGHGPHAKKGLIC